MRNQSVGRRYYIDIASHMTLYAVVESITLCFIAVILLG